jgi:hypothetical protein
MMGWWSFGAPWASRRAACAALRQRLGALCLLTLFVTASIISGKTYLWCVPMQQAMHACCCARADGTEPDVRPSELPAVRESCCISQVVGELPVAPIPPVEAVPPVPSTFVVVPKGLVEPPPVLAQRSSFLPPRLRRYGPTRAGPCSASDSCIKLQVFRC